MYNYWRQTTKFRSIPSQILNFSKSKWQATTQTDRRHIFVSFQARKMHRCRRVIPYLNTHQIYLNVNSFFRNLSRVFSSIPRIYRSRIETLPPIFRNPYKPFPSFAALFTLDAVKKEKYKHEKKKMKKTNREKMKVE